MGIICRDHRYFSSAIQPTQGNGSGSDDGILSCDCFSCPVDLYKISISISLGSSSERGSTRVHSARWTWSQSAFTKFLDDNSSAGTLHRICIIGSSVCPRCGSSLAEKVQ